MKRRSEILTLRAAGITNRQIAERLGLSDTHVSAVANGRHSYGVSVTAEAFARIREASKRRGMSMRELVERAVKGVGDQ